MKTKPLLRFLLPAVLFSLAHIASAQLDSLYSQQWNRDPVTDLKYTVSAQRQIITAEQIRVSGYTRLNDLVQLFDSWTFATIDGNNWLVQSNGTGAYDMQNWILMVNGQRVELNRAHTLDLNLLGISVVDIERIEIVNTNGMYLGEFTQNGLINIITKKSSKNGVNYRGYGSLHFSNPNGSSYFYGGENTYHTIGYTKNKFHVNASYGSMYNGVPGTLRNGKYSGGTNTSYRLESQYTGNKFSHQVNASVLKREESSRFSENVQAGYLGIFNITNQHQLRLSSTYTDLKDDLTNAALSTSTLQYRYMKHQKHGNLIWQTGVAGDFFNYKVHADRVAFLDAFLGNGFNITDTNVFIIKPYTSINIPITRKTNLFSDVQVAFAHGKTAPRVSVGIYKKVSLISNYSFVLGYTETLLEEAFMTNIGQRVNAIEGATYFYNPKISSADFYYNLNIGNSVKFSFNSGLKNTYALPAIDNSTTFLTIKRNSYNLNWINRFNIHYDIVKNLVFDINYLNTRSVDTWNENLQNIPKHKFTFTFQYDLPKRFTLWSRNYWQSKTSFWNYTQDDPLYVTLPSFFTWDLGISKKLFKDYLLFNLSARNILNTHEQYYPTGAQFDIRFSLGLTANIEGFFAKGNSKP